MVLIHSLFSFVALHSFRYLKIWIFELVGRNHARRTHAIYEWIRYSMYMYVYACAQGTLHQQNDGNDDIDVLCVCVCMYVYDSMVVG